jgi:hypothetical protein
MREMEAAERVDCRVSPPWLLDPPQVVVHPHDVLTMIIAR